MPTTINPSDQTITQYNVQTGGASNLLNNVAPSATSGVPVISQGAASQPVFGTAVVAGGGTGNTTFTAYSVITAGTTATGAFQNVSGVGTANQLLTSNGAAALPTWQTSPAFFAYLQTSQSLVTGDTTQVTVKCDTVDFDTTSSYATGTGLYTAPIAGNYFFFAQILYSGTMTLITFMEAILGNSGIRNAKAFLNCTAGTHTSQSSVNVQIQIALTVGQTITLLAQANGAASKVVTIEGNGGSAVQSTFFGGRMLR